MAMHVKRLAIGPYQRCRSGATDARRAACVVLAANVPELQKPASLALLPIAAGLQFAEGQASVQLLVFTKLMP